MTDLKPTPARLRALRLALTHDWHPAGTGEHQLVTRLREAGLIRHYSAGGLDVTDQGKAWLVRHGVTQPTVPRSTCGCPCNFCERGEHDRCYRCPA
jgi:hypothetical protein